MYALATISPAMPPVYPVLPSPLKVQSLALGQEAEVLAFLATRPLHTSDYG
jgi:hypothetical protein